jgi:AraC family transcriptional regulator, transcriptional activator of pobA
MKNTHGKFSKTAMPNYAWLGTDMSMSYFDMFIWGYKDNPYDTSKPHSHAYNEVLIFNEGGGVHQIDGVSFPISDNSVHFVPKGALHTVIRNVKSAGSTFLLNSDYFGNCPLKKQYVESLPFFKHALGGHIIEFKDNRFEKIRFLIEQIKEEYLSVVKDKIRTEAIQTSVHSFLLACQREMNLSGVLTPKTVWHHHNPMMEKLLDLIEIHYKKRFSVEKYADLLFISVSQLNRQCHATFQKTVLELIHDRVLKEAKNQLLFTQESVKEIAWELGFEYSANFIEFFTKKVGMSPTHFRETTE